MTLSDIAAGIETTTRQRDRGVAAVDGTERTLADRLAAFADELPCAAAEAATVAETYAEGASVGEAAAAAALAPVTAAKALHRLGIDGITPFSPTQRRILRDWLSAELSRTDALELTGASETEFALATYVETHDPIPGAHDCVESALATGASTVAKRDHLAETMSGVDDL